RTRRPIRADRLSTGACRAGCARRGAPVRPASALRRALPWIVATAGYTALVLWLTWPLAPSCADHLPDPVGLLGFWGWTYLFDLEFTAWALAWDVHALWEAPANFFQA